MRIWDSMARPCLVAIATFVAAGCYTGMDRDDGAASAADGDSGGADGNSGPDGDGTDTGEPSGPDDPDLVGLSGMRRLSVSEYAITIFDLLGDDELSAELQMPVDPRTPFDNDYTEQVASKGLIDAADFLAGKAAENLLADPAKRDDVVGCAPAGPDDEACMRSFITDFGRRALRRPLTDEEVDLYLHGVNGDNGAIEHAIEADDFYVGIDTLVRTFLQEPEFLYRVETGTETETEGVFALSQFELAARMSYFMWGSTPDDELLDRAAAGALSAPEQVREAATAMLQDEHALARVERFHQMWFAFETLPHEAAISGAMKAETHELIKRVIFDEQLPWQDLFRFQETYVPDVLAELYGLPSPGSETGQWVDYDDTGRQGLLSHGTFLSNGAKFNDTSPVQRGLLIRERLFCQDIEDPPPGVDTDSPPVAPEEAICKVDRFAAHGQGGCAGCHQLLDPVGFGLEQYDAMGQFRTFEPDNPDTPEDESQCEITGDGELVEIGQFNGPAELSDLMLSDPSLNHCLNTMLYRFVVGRTELDERDELFVERLDETLGSGDIRFDQLLLEVVSHESFRFRREEG